MGRMSKVKGKVGEREFAKWLTDQGFPAERGWADGYDIECKGLPVHFEVKRVEALHLWPSLDQSWKDTKEGDISVVAHRPNRKPWIIILRAWQFLELMRENRDLKDIVKELETRNQYLEKQWEETPA